MNAFVQWSVLVACIMGLVEVTDESIAGVTYRDHFDFEERYRNKHECDPLYWHPLHLPEHCNKMYEKLIRSRLKNREPIDKVFGDDVEKYLKIFKTEIEPQRRDRDEPSDSSCEDTSRSSSSEEGCHSSRQSQASNPLVVDLDYVNYLTDMLPNFENQENHPPPTPGPPSDLWVPPYLQMLNMIKADVMKLPAAPVIGVLPNLGLAAIYRQPISTKTEEIIKKIASAYASAAQKSYQESGILPYPYPLGPPYLLPLNDTNSNTTSTPQPAVVIVAKEGRMKPSPDNAGPQNKNNKNEIIKKTIINDNFMAFITKKKILG